MSQDVGAVEFHHVHFYVNEVKPLEFYKSLESKFNTFAASVSKGDISEEKGRTVWEEQNKTKVNPEAYVSQGQDLICQAISGLGWRVTGYYTGDTTTSALVTSRDPDGVRFVVTGPNNKEPATKKAKTDTSYPHFEIGEWKTFKSTHIDREGVSVLAFKCDAGVLKQIEAKYREKHPKLIKSVHTSKHGKEDFTVLEVYAYYLPDKNEEDKGTTLRFVESGNKDITLPGLEPVKAEFAKGWDCPAYCDHWVSNVKDRKGFLKTLGDTLDFIPKVDFNAGVVAAGEAIIESTVIGNSPSGKLVDEAAALKTQQQVFLPINNPLSSVGHVHGFIEEIGQGIQHLASRVQDLGQFIGRINKIREMTGEGFKFLGIPRSYYGRLSVQNISDVGVKAVTAAGILEKLSEKKLVSRTGIVLFDITDEQIISALEGVDTESKLNDVVVIVKRARYNNMYKLLRNHVTEESYLRLVKNKILVDIQGSDMLYQIFTVNILQAKAGDESPFLEFIQRVCSEKKDKSGNPVPIRPGCGGFGIRNFLTLFLSIEVSKAMLEMEKAQEAKDETATTLACKVVDTFTDQLDESNPILTMISDAMTAEGDCFLELKTETNPEEKAKLQKQVEEHKAQKEKGNALLQDCSDKYKAIMKELRSQKK